MYNRPGCVGNYRWYGAHHTERFFLTPPPSAKQFLSVVSADKFWTRFFGLENNPSCRYYRKRKNRV